ncbi:MAG: selenoneine biosynthesis selenosugar synthase SenB [Deltaproteobacteria bacterium]
MKIQLATPAAPGTLNGNGVLAERWAGFLDELGHRVEITNPTTVGEADLLIAVHAKRSARAIVGQAAANPRCPIVVILAGTDIYGAVQEKDDETLHSIDAADLLVTLQPLASRELGRDTAAKVRVVFQSAVASPLTTKPCTDRFDIAMVGNIRRLKGQLTVIAALDLLPARSKARVLHAGSVLEPELGARLRAESRSGARYRWLGSLGHEQTKRLIAGCHLLVHPSRREGGANVIGEAVVAGVPVLASRIPGSVGLLGTGYPGYFPAGDARRLAELISLVENDEWHCSRLRGYCRRLAAQFDHAAEREAIRRVIEEATERGAGAA